MSLVRKLYREGANIVLGSKQVYLKRKELLAAPLGDQMNKIIKSYRTHLEQKSPMLTTFGTIGCTYALGELIAQTITGHYDISRIATFATFGVTIGGPCYYAWFNYLDTIPGKLLVESNKYKELVCQRLPELLQNHLSISIKRNLVVNAFTQMDTTVKDADQNDVNIPANTDIKVYVPEDTKICVTALKFEAHRVETINKWAVKGVKVLADQLLFSSTYTLILITSIGFMTGQDLVTIASTIQSSFWKIYLLDCIVWPPLQVINFTFIKKEYQPLYVNVLNIAWNTVLCLILGGAH